MVGWYVANPEDIGLFQAQLADMWHILKILYCFRPSWLVCGTPGRYWTVLGPVGWYAAHPEDELREEALAPPHQAMYPAT